MTYFQYNKEAQGKFSVGGGEPFLKNIAQNRVFILKEGTFQIRIMPPWSRAGLFAKFSKIHWQVGLSRSTFVCPTMFGAESCPFCEVYSQLVSEYDKYAPDVNACRPAKRYYSNVINLGSTPVGVMVYSYGQKVYGAIKGLQDSGDYGDITDPTTGCNITLTRQGSGRNVQDHVMPARNASPLQNPDWLDQLFDLDDIFVEPDMGDVNAAFATQPWKVWTPPSGEKPASVVAGRVMPPPGQVEKQQEQTPAVIEKATPVVATEDKAQPVVAEVTKDAVPEQAVNTEQVVEEKAPGKVDAIKSLEARLREKLNK